MILKFIDKICLFMCVNKMFLKVMNGGERHNGFKLYVIFKLLKINA